MKTITTESWQLKFRNTISLYFDACCVNAQNERTNNIPNSVDAYIKIRRNSGAVMTSFNLIEPLLGIQVSYDNQDLQNLMDNLMDYCNDHICFTNDLYSLKKELMEGEVDNIIVVLRQLHQYSLQEAITYTIDLINKRIYLYLINVSILIIALIIANCLPMQPPNPLPKYIIFGMLIMENLL
ncbi:1492_t:CDS:2 [Racocetra fulgida]|uniref:1492_t:CDS:1 n=1 Tax=Racocetra fulgida TaxID=60492 RepID=A0A9N8VLI3_9GLOM|nr:1492_t:CDS:2 [Racocetra fulgida]